MSAIPPGDFRARGGRLLSGHARRKPDAADSLGLPRDVSNATLSRRPALATYRRVSANLPTLTLGLPKQPFPPLSASKPVAPAMIARNDLECQITAALPSAYQRDGDAIDAIREME
jgi:hypothetical protein